MVNGELSWSQRIICLPFTVYCSPPALRSALGALRHEPGPLGPDSLLGGDKPTPMKKITLAVFGGTMIILLHGCRMPEGLAYGARQKH